MTMGASSRVFQRLRLQRFVRSRLLNDLICRVFHGVPGRM